MIAFNLTRAAATLTGPALATATTATVRRKLITVPARLASSARRFDPAPPERLALGNRLAPTVHPRVRSTHPRDQLTNRRAIGPPGPPASNLLTARSVPCRL